MSGEQRKFAELELSVPQIAGGALASVTAAVAASKLGVAGTVIGAAVASIASTVGGAIYTHYLKRTGEKVKQHTVIAWRDRTDLPVHEDGEGELATAVHATVREEEPAESTLVMAPVEERRPFPWLKLGLATALVFALSMAAILAYQGLAKRTVYETVTGKTPETEHQKAPQKQEDKPSEAATTAPPATKSATPTPTPTPTTSPSKKPTPTPTPTETTSVDPSSPPTPTPSQEQTTPNPADQDEPPETPDNTQPTS